MYLKLSNFKNSMKFALICCIGLATLSTQVSAADDTAKGEKIIITGSRIRQSDVEGKSPVRIIDQEDIQRTGLKSIGDILQQLSISGSAINTRFNSSGNFGFPPDGGGIGAGSTQINLRHLGANRVLVLVDGLRWVNGSSGSGVSNATDLNTIPLSAVDHIEVLEDGASAVYGSDAIAGVVNIITKKATDGLEVNAYSGQFDKGDGASNSIDISMSTSSEKSRVFLTLSHFEQDPVSANDRSLARVPAPGTSGGTHGSSGTPTGRFVFVDPVVGVVSITPNDGASGSLIYDPANPGASDFHNFTSADRFNFSQYNLYVTPSKRNNIFSSAEYDVSKDVTVYFKGMFNERQSTNRAAPEPIFIGPEAGTGGLGDLTTIDVTNPYNPFGFTLDASNFIFAGRRPIEGGARIFKQDVNTSYLGTGVKGVWNVGDKIYEWDVNYAWSKNRADQIKTGGYNSRHILTALGPLATCQATPGCVPLNIFGAGSITQDMLDYISFTQKDVSQNAMRLLSANLTGELFDMPAGSAGFAVGFESRHQSGFFEPDAVVTAGETNGVPSSPTSGAFNVDEYYGELNLPVISGSQDLSVSIAFRSSDYNTSGSKTTSKYGFKYQPFDDLIVRGSFSEGFRAPSIGELFSSASRFDATLTDPCSNASASNQARCLALGVPAGFVGTGGQISVITGGNADLNPESSKSKNFGFVYSPEFVSDLDWVDSFHISYNYYNIELDHAIQAIDAQTQLDQCVVASNDSFCNGITRTTAGTIVNFQNRLVNIGRIDTNGYDIKLGYLSPVYDWGQLAINWNNTIVNSYKESALGLVTSLEGIERNDRGIPKWKFDLTFDWKRGDWGASWTMRYVDSLTESCSDFQDGSSVSFVALGLCSQPNTVDEGLSLNKLNSTSVHDLQVRWTPSNWETDIQFSGGIQNLFNQDPPACMSCSLNGYDPSTYWSQGQFFYLQASLKL